MKTKLLANIEFRKARLEKGLSQGELSGLAGVSRQCISDIENQRYGISTKLANKLSEILEKKYKEIFFVHILHSIEENINSDELINDKEKAS